MLNNRQNMMKYRPGDIAYIVSNNRWVRTVEVVGASYGLITVHILERNSHIRLRENRLFPTEEAAKASLPKTVILFFLLAMQKQCLNT